MSDKNAEPLDAELDAQQTKIEHIETQINLKDASVACETEVKSLQAAQQMHRDKIHDLEESQKRPR